MPNSISRPSGPSNVIAQPTITGRSQTVQPSQAAPGTVSPKPTTAMVANHEVLARYLSDLERRFSTVTQLAQSGLFQGANLLTGIKVTASSVATVAHQLGRIPKGRIVVEQSAAGTILVAALPASRDATKYYAFTPTFTGTISLLFF